MTSTADGPNVAPATANNAAGKKSRARKAKNEALLEAKKEDEKIGSFFAKENNITVQGKTKNSIFTEVLEACQCASVLELRDLYQIRFHKEKTTSDTTKTFSV